MNKKIILFVMNELTAGGAERVIVNLANNFDREKFDVHLCLFKKTGQLVDSLQDDITLHDLKSARVRNGALKFFLLTLSLKPDFVFSNIYHVNLFVSIQIKALRLLLKNTKFIARETNTPSLRAKYKKSSSKGDLIFKRTINNFDRVIAQSRYMRDDLVDTYNINQDKISVINNPLDIKNINLQLNKPISKKETLFIKNKKTHILAIGALQEQKGFDNLLKAVPYLDDRLHLNILGDDRKKEEKEILVKIINDLNITERVTFLGYQKNPYEFINKSDLVVLSSRYEGFPNVVIESHACGKFVVAFECPGVNSEIIKNDVNGYLVENGNIKALADSINKYSKMNFDNKRIKQTTDRYHVNKIIEEYEQILFNL